MPRPRFFLPMSSAAAVVVIAAVTVATQATEARPGGAHVAAAAVPSDSTAHPHATTAVAIDPALTGALRSRMAKSTAASYAMVVDVEGIGRVVDVNGSAGMLPASTEKLFTTLPLLLNRPQDRLVTMIGTTATPAGGVVRGDLVVHASGDPTIMGSSLIDLARQVRANGVRRVTGRLVLALGGLAQSRTRIGWKSAYVPGDIGPLSPFPVHYNTWRGGSSYIAHPTAGNLALLRSKLAAAGVRIAGGSAVVSGASVSTIVATHSSPTIAAIIDNTLRWSDNFAAEQLLTVEGWGPLNSLARTVGAGGIATDGSGLSLRDRRTAEGEVALLEYAHTSTAANALLHSLPVACRTGTLRHEMCSTVGEAHVFAKTGTLSHVKTLAGYTTDAQGRWVTFAFLTGGATSTYKAMNAIERSLLVLRHYGG